MGNNLSEPPCSSGTERNRREAGGIAATSLNSSTSSCVSSFEKTVLLHDWWLIKAEDECRRPRLAVGGLAMTGKAVRIFKSAPIVNRYDGYTLETADGVTVRIQGLINASRMRQNGFPSEACNHFRIGFPYCWNDYADKYFRTDTDGAPTCASEAHECHVNSVNTVNKCFPICSKEFPFSVMVESLNSMCKEIIDGAQRSSDTATKVSKNNGSSVKTIPADDSIMVTDTNSNIAEDKSSMATKIDTLDGLEQDSGCVLHDSLFMNNESLLKEAATFQRESLATAFAGPAEQKEQIGHASIDLDGLAEAVDENPYCGNSSLVDSGANVSWSMSVTDNLEELVSMAPNKNYTDVESEKLVHLSVTSLSHEVDAGLMKSPDKQLQMFSSNPVNNSLNQHAANKHISISRTFTGMNHNHEESRGFAHIDGAESLNNAMNLEVSGAIQNFSNMVSNHEFAYDSDENMVGSVESTMMPSNRSRRRAAAVKKGKYEKISPGSCITDVRGKLSGVSRNATKEPSFVLVKDVHQCLEMGEMQQIGSKTVDPVSDEVIAECSYNEVNLQPESSKKMPSHTFVSMNSPCNIDANPDENSTDSPDAGVRVSEFSTKQLSLRRSKRLSKFKDPTEDSARSLESIDGNLAKTNSESMEDETHIRHSSAPVIKRGASATGAIDVDTADFCAAAACKLKFSLQKSPHGHSVTTNEDVLSVETQGNKTCSLESQVRHDKCLQKNSQSDQDKNLEDIVNGAHDSSHLTGSRREVDVDNLDMSTEEENSFNVGISRVTGCDKKVNQFIEAGTPNPDMPPGVQSRSGVGINCVVEHANKVHLSHDGKSSPKPAKRSKRKTHCNSQGEETPLTRQRIKVLKTKGISFASPELLNFKRSRSGRLLVPTIANWCQQVLYDVDGSVAGILTGFDTFACDRRGTRSEPTKKR